MIIVDGDLSDDDKTIHNNNNQSPSSIDMFLSISV